jgi:hypothetical protein
MHTDRAARGSGRIRRARAEAEAETEPHRRAAEWRRRHGAVRAASAAGGGIEEGAKAEGGPAVGEWKSGRGKKSAKVFFF